MSFCLCVCVYLVTTTEIYDKGKLRSALRSCLDFRACDTTPIKALEAETYVVPMQPHLTRLQGKSGFHMRSAGQANLVAKVCAQGHLKFDNRMSHRPCAPETVVE